MCLEDACVQVQGGGHARASASVGMERSVRVEMAAMMPVGTARTKLVMPSASVKPCAPRSSLRLAPMRGVRAEPTR
ncbi:hypothetical protein ACFPRL_12375 [Pseudoclavibacter helvolus]